MIRAHFTNDFINPAERPRAPRRIESFVQRISHFGQFQFQQDAPEQFQLFRAHAVNAPVQLGPEFFRFNVRSTHG